MTADVVRAVLGAALVVVLARDVFHTIGHPGGQGTLCRLVMQGVWRLARRLGGGRAPTTAGPAGMVAVVAVWTLVAVTGWALVYVGQMPEGFSFSPGLTPALRSDVLDAGYVSLVTLATLGFGDVVPTAGWLRVATALQALTGFALLTAAVSWLQQVYPALTRRRTFALRVDVLRRTVDSDGDDAVLRAATGTLVEGLVRTRVDLQSYAETYWFPDADDATSLAVQLLWLDEHCDRTELRLALDDLAATLSAGFGLGTGPRRDVLRAYARAQRGVAAGH